jgi:hypothetical protein
VPLLRRLNHARVSGRLQKKVILYQTASRAESLLTNAVTVGHRANRKADLSAPAPEALSLDELSRLSTAPSKRLKVYR